MSKKSVRKHILKHKNILHELEPRMLLSGSPLATPALVFAAAWNNTPGSDGYTPAQVSQAYGFNQITFGSAGNGAGETIAIVDAYNDPDILSDANTFNSNSNISLPSFNTLGGPTLTVLGQTGTSTLPANAPMTGTDWGVEESLDVEWAHALAPQANLILFEANNDSLANLTATVRAAANYTGVSVISMSWGAPDFSGETGYDSDFTTPAGHANVTFLASSGDSGSAAGPNYPAVSPNVIGVGGTSLSLNGNNTRSSETVWYTNSGNATGGGISSYETVPSYQAGVSATKRYEPDVAFDADPATGVPIYDSYDGATLPWGQIGGTSLSAPAWAALTAIANQARAQVSLSTLDSTTALTDLYNLPSSDFYDVTSGTNGTYSAGSGYDLVTGLGTPVANKIVTGLANSIQNAGFELGNLTGWTSGGTPSVVTGSSYSGTYAAQIGSGSYIYQTITGLQADTTYTVTVNGKVSAGGSAELYLENYDGGTNALTAAVTSNTYSQQIITFTTGSTNTSAVIVLAGISGTATFDNVALQQLAPAANFGFETGTLAGWTSSGTASVVSGSPYSGVYAVQLGSTSYVDQLIAGLQVNTTYTVTVNAKISSGGSAELYIENYDGGADALTESVPSTSYSSMTITFTTGSSNTSAYIVLQGLSGTSEFDNVNIQQLAPAANLGFESATLAGWTLGGTGGVVAGGYSGGYAVQLGSSSYIYQTFTGLEPDTTYYVTAEGKVSSGGSADLYVVGSDGGSSSLYATVPSSSYSQQTLTFTTGLSNTYATIELAGISGISDFDSVNIQQLAPAANFGFEAGNLAGWTSSGSASVVSGSAYNGAYAVQLGSISYVDRLITGLQVNTTYTATVNAKVSSGGSAELYIENYDGGASALTEAVPSSSYSPMTITFTTGSSNTSAYVVLQGLSGTSEFDNVNVRQLAPAANFGFEGGTLSGWTSSGAAGVVSGGYGGSNYAIQLGTGAFLTQVITGLQPNTTYTFTAYGKSTTSNGASIEVTSYGGGSPISDAVSTSSYGSLSVTFTTGASATSATIELNDTGTGTADFDNINFLQ